MAYARKKKTEEATWKEVKGMSGFTVIGTKSRFSVSFEPFEGFRIGINGCRVIDGKNGSFISFPAWKDASGKYHDYCYMTFSDEEIGAIINTLDE